MYSNKEAFSRRALTWRFLRCVLMILILGVVPITRALALDLLNESTRGFVGTGESRMVVGFVVVGSDTEQFVLFGIGPTLADSGVSGVLPNPKITLINNSSGETIDSNDDWGSHASASLTAQFLGQNGLSIDDLDAVMVLDLAAGSYSLLVEGVGGTTGVALGGVEKASSIDQFSTCCIGGSPSQVSFEICQLSGGLFLGDVNPVPNPCP